MKAALINIFILSLAPFTTVAFDLNNANILNNQVINVWDNVLTPSLCDNLHKEASSIGLGHTAFSRPIAGLDDESKLNRPLIELAIDQILKNMYSDEISNETDTSRIQYIEYWTRQEWRHIEAHADVDEHLAKDQDKDGTIIGDDGKPLPFRYPTKGHVLYLKIGTDVKGPTCLFPNISSGGDFLNNDNGKKHVDLVTVPAIDGRLLRFDGDVLHAVPRPHDIWFLSFVKGSFDFSPMEIWGRSVILFNIWEEPPKDVPLDEQIPDDNANGIDLVKVGVQNFKDWTNTFSMDEEEANYSDETTCGDETLFGRPAKIWLLGNERRRGHQMRTIKLKAPEEVRNILEESHKVNRIQLTK